MWYLSDRSRSIMLIVLCQVACMTLWFSASAAVPALLSRGEISGGQASLLTGAVQLGFVAGTLGSALLGLADKLESRKFFAIAGVAAAFANGLLLYSSPDSTIAVLLRGLTGMCLAGIYPIGMKLAVGWSNARNKGLMVGALVGALTLGSALPHLFGTFHSVDWRAAIVISSVCAVAGAIAINFVAVAPDRMVRTACAPGEIVHLLQSRPVKLVSIGYFGHMWELYAMWAWIAPFLVWALHDGRDLPFLCQPAIVTFAVIAAGSAGCVVTGMVADWIGRTLVTAVAMVASALCAATIGVVQLAGPGPVIVVAVIWGITVVADSAQFSVATAELSEPSSLGTMLTFQTCLGFLVTFVTIQLMPLAIEHLTWRFAFVPLSIGPAIGTFAMLRLRADPAALRLANGAK